jgi:hypothetical protein
VAPLEVTEELLDPYQNTQTQTIKASEIVVKSEEK